MYLANGTYAGQRRRVPRKRSDEVGGRFGVDAERGNRIANVDRRWVSLVSRDVEWLESRCGQAHVRWRSHRERDESYTDESRLTPHHALAPVGRCRSRTPNPVTRATLRVPAS